MKRIRKERRKKPARRVQEEEAWIRDLNNQLVRHNGKKMHEPDGRCAYCGKVLWPGTWHEMYDEFGQLVKKCNNERSCSRKRAKRMGQEESFRRALRYFNSHGTEGKWMDP